MIREGILKLNRIKGILAIGFFVLIVGAALIAKQLLGLPVSTIRAVSVLAVVCAAGGAMFAAAVGLAIKTFGLGLSGPEFFQYSGAQATRALQGADATATKKGALLTYLLVEALLVVLLGVSAAGGALILYLK